MHLCLVGKTIVHIPAHGIRWLHTGGLAHQPDALVPVPQQMALRRESVHAIPYFEPVQAKPTLASAIQIGHPVSIKKAIRVLKKFSGTVEQASEEELSEAAAEADMTGLYNCPHTGVALAALKKMILREEVRSDERVVVISTAHGLKFTSFKTSYHDSDHRDTQCRFANPPIEVPAKYDSVRDALFRALETRNSHFVKP